MKIAPSCCLFLIFRGTRTVQRDLFLTVIMGTFKAYQSDRCLVVCYRYSRLLPFHGGNTGSNPVGDAKFVFSSTI